MRYSYEFKLECVHLYKNTGSFPPTPENVKQHSFREKIMKWARMYDIHGPDVLNHSNVNRKWTPEDKLVLINQYKAGKSMTSVSIEAGIDSGLLYTWIRKYEELGYNGLVESKKGRPRKNPDMSKKTEKEGVVNRSYLDLLDKTMKRCREKGVELRMYISPEFSQKSALTTAAAEEIGSVAMNNNVSFTNAHSDECFMQDATLFKDASHLNDKGARMFTEKVICKILNNE